MKWMGLLLCLCLMGCSGELYPNLKKIKIIVQRQSNGQVVSGEGNRFTKEYSVGGETPDYYVLKEIDLSVPKNPEKKIKTYFTERWNDLQFVSLWEDGDRVKEGKEVK
jgi:hypothetical protein